MSRSDRLAKPSLEWAKGKEDKEKFIELVSSSTLVLGQLLSLIDDQLKEIERMEMSQDVYLSPGYHDWQAHMNGRKAGLHQVRNLLSFIDTPA